MSRSIEELRSEMPVVNQVAYFDHAAVGPLPRPTAEIITRYANDFSQNGHANWFEWRERVEEVRRNCAALVSADEDEIALIRNTTEGISLVAEGIDWKEGDNVLTLEGEFPSNRLPWTNLKSRGVEVRTVPSDRERIPPSTLDQYRDSRTRLLTISWVNYKAGYRADLETICEWTQKHGILLFVDGIQGLGMFPLNLSDLPIDFFAADGHKWMLGPEGAGMLYIQKKRLEELRPLGVGWNSVQGAGEFSNPDPELKRDASRYEGGSINMVGFAGFGESLKLLRSFDQEAITERLKWITNLLCERLQSIGFELASDRRETHWSGILSGTLPGMSALEARTAAASQGVAINARAGRIRISPHAYTTEADVEKLLAVLKG